MADLGPLSVQPPCLYYFQPQSRVPQQVRLSDPVAGQRGDNDGVQWLPPKSGGRINYVDFHVAFRDRETVRTTRIIRDGTVQREFGASAIRR